MAILLTNFAATTLAFSITNADLALTVASGTGALFPSPTGGDYFYLTLEDSSLNKEIVKVTARSGDVMTIVRAQEGTTARAFTSSSSAALRITAATFNDSQARTSTTGSLITPTGTTAQRDGSPATGYFRFNTTLTQLEAWFSAAWNKILTAVDVGVVVQAYDANTVKSNLNQTFTKAQRGAYNVLTDGATITPDFSLGNMHRVQLGGNRTLAVPTNLVAGQSGCIDIYQDSTGSRTLSYQWGWQFINGTAPTLSTSARAKDKLNYQVDVYAQSTVTITIAAPGVVSWTAHGLMAGQQVQLTTTGALPTGLTANTTYFVVPVDANSFQLAATQSGTAITTSGTQSGVHTMTACSITGQLMGGVA